MYGVPSSIASFSMASNPSQNCGVGWFFSLGMDLPRFSNVALVLFSSEDVLVPPVLFCPCGGELVSNITKSGSSVRILAAPLPCPVILVLQEMSLVIGWGLFIFEFSVRFLLGLLLKYFEASPLLLTAARSEAL